MENKALGQRLKTIAVQVGTGMAEVGLGAANELSGDRAARGSKGRRMAGIVPAGRFAVDVGHGVKVVKSAIHGEATRDDFVQAAARLTASGTETAFPLYILVTKVGGSLTRRALRHTGVIPDEKP
jgi:hypothetical protein